MQYIIAHKFELVASLLALSELLALNPWTKSNAVVQLLFNASKSLYKLVIGKDAPVIDDGSQPPSA